MNGEVIHIELQRAKAVEAVVAHIEQSAPSAHYIDRGLPSTVYIDRILKETLEL